MNYIVISPYYPQNFQQFTVELANKGITVLVSNHIMNTGWNWMQLFVNSLMYLVLSQRTSRRQNTNLK